MWGPRTLCMGASSHTNHHTRVIRRGVPVHCVWGKKSRIWAPPCLSCRIFWRMLGNGRAENFLGCACLRSMLGTVHHCSTWVAEIQGYCYRVQDVLQCISKSKYSTYRDNVPDLSPKSSALEFSNRPLKSQNRLLNQTQSPFEANNSRQLPVEANNSRQSRFEANVSTHSHADVPMQVKPIGKWITSYGEKYWSTHCSRARWATHHCKWKDLAVSKISRIKPSLHNDQNLNRKWKYRQHRTGYFPLLSVFNSSWFT